MHKDEAESIAISGLAFVAQDHELMRRFLDLTGVDADSIRQAAREPGFLAGVLQFIIAHEPTLLRFSADSGVPPEKAVLAIESLPFGQTTGGYEP